MQTPFVMQFKMANPIFGSTKKRGLFFHLNFVDLLKYKLLPPQEVKRLMNHVKHKIVIKYLTLNC